MSVLIQVRSCPPGRPDDQHVTAQQPIPQLQQRAGRMADRPDHRPELRVAAPRQQRCPPNPPAADMIPAVRSKVSVNSTSMHQTWPRNSPEPSRHGKARSVSRVPSLTPSPPAAHAAGFQAVTNPAQPATFSQHQHDSGTTGSTQRCGAIAPLSHWPAARSTTTTCPNTRQPGCTGAPPPCLTTHTHPEGPEDVWSGTATAQQADKQQHKVKVKVETPTACAPRGGPKRCTQQTRRGNSKPHVDRRASTSRRVLPQSTPSSVASLVSPGIAPARYRRSIPRTISRASPW